MNTFFELPADYRPHIDEPFMNQRQQEYFRQRLLTWREEIVQHSLDALEHLQKDSLHESDDVDQACLEEELFEELALRDREAKLLVKIDEALQRLDEGTYGYCVVTGEPIDLRRLEARLVATHSLKAREDYEHEMRVDL